MVEHSTNKGGFVWIVAGIGLAVYATAGLLLQDIPGIEQLTTWLSSLSGWWILLAAFIAMFLEGLYFIGSFFPGTSIVVLLAILAGGTNIAFFVLLLLIIYTAWVLAGIVNVVLAKQFGSSTDTVETVTEDRILETWFPAFRANHEVAQVLSGKGRWPVLFSSMRVKLFGMVVFVIHGTVVPLFIDITDASNQEGFASLYIFAAIMLVVGVMQMRGTAVFPTS